MIVPNIIGYRIDEVEVPEPKPDDQIIREVLGLAPVAPRGAPRRMLRITMAADQFPQTTEPPYNITIGDQMLRGLEIAPDGRRASGLIAAMPAEGDVIALRVPTKPQLGQDGVMRAGLFEHAKLDIGVA
jgi:hypothetical protein